MSSPSKGFVIVASKQWAFYASAVNLIDSILDYYEDARITLFKGWERMINPLAMKAYDEYYTLSKENNITMVQLAQAFVNSRPFVTSNIIGATTMDQLKENIESIKIELTEEVLEKINVIHNNNPNPAP